VSSKSFPSEGTGAVWMNWSSCRIGCYPDLQRERSVCPAEMNWPPSCLVCCVIIEVPLPLVRINNCSPVAPFGYHQSQPCSQDRTVLSRLASNKRTGPHPGSGETGSPPEGLNVKAKTSTQIQYGAPPPLFRANLICEAPEMKMTGLDFGSLCGGVGFGTEKPPWPGFPVSSSDSVIRKVVQQSLVSEDSAASRQTGDVWSLRTTDRRTWLLPTYAISAACMHGASAIGKHIATAGVLFEKDRLVNCKLASPSRIRGWKSSATLLRTGLLPGVVAGLHGSTPSGRAENRLQ
jgi:hypothetical protein